MSIIIQNEMMKRSIEKKKSTSLAHIARFQKRWFVLQKDQLIYRSKSGKNWKGSISVLSVRICEDVESVAFERQHVFQIGFLEKGKLFHLYIAAADRKMREKWKEEIRELCSCYVAMVMYKTYHKGVYKKKAWTCCFKDGSYDSGCTTSFTYQEKLSRAKLLGDIRSPMVNKAPTLSPYDSRKNNGMGRGRVHMPSECDMSYSDVVDEVGEGLEGMAWSSTESLADDKAKDVACEDEDEEGRATRLMRASIEKKGSSKACSLQRIIKPTVVKVTGDDGWEYGRFTKSRTLPTKEFYSVNSSPGSLNRIITSPTPSSSSVERLSRQVSLERANSAASSVSITSSMMGNRPSLTTLSRRLNSQGSSVFSDSIPRTGSDYQSSLEPEEEEADAPPPRPHLPSSVARHLLDHSQEKASRCSSGCYVNIREKS